MSEIRIVKPDDYRLDIDRYAGAKIARVEYDEAPLHMGAFANWLLSPKPRVYRDLRDQLPSDEIPWRWLTGSFVEAIGLEEVPVKLQRTGQVVSAGQVGGLIPRPDGSLYARGVIFRGFVYLREHDGLAFVRKWMLPRATVPIVKR